MIDKSLIREFGKIVGEENVLASKEALDAYSYDGTTNWIHRPDVVVFPATADHICAILKIATREKIPVTPRGAGSCLSGGPVPVRGGIVLCLTNLKKVLKIDVQNRTVVLEPGVVLFDLNNLVGRHGLFFPPDPQSYLSATIGGMIAENAGGPACLKYGVTQRYIRGIEFALASGSLINIGKGTFNSAGYNLLEVIIGSEGTLGVVTKAEISVIPIPPVRQTILAVYDDVAVAGENVSRVLENGVIPGKIELMDNWVINRFEDMLQVGLPRDADAVLLFEVDGTPEAVEAETEKIFEISKEHGVREVRVAKDADEANRYWMGRRAGFAAVFGAAATVMAEDVTVPRGRIPDLIKKCKELAKTFDVEIVVLGHAGDGNLHPSILTDIRNKEHYDRACKAMHEIFIAAIEMGGVISGEHGIGLEKQEFFSQSVDPQTLRLMKGIKSLLDPDNIMNPGKIWS
jgi:glycolate oxidase